MRERIRYWILLALLAGFPGTSGADEILRDPTRPYVPLVRSAVAAPGFTVNAIIVSSERRVAIVNGRRVAVGDSVDGATVVSIEKKGLVLDQGGKLITVELK